MLNLPAALLLIAILSEIFKIPKTSRLGIPVIGESLILTYGLLYGTARVLIWRAIAGRIARNREDLAVQRWFWSVGGALLSFATDALGLTMGALAIGGFC